MFKSNLIIFFLFLGTTITSQDLSESLYLSTDQPIISAHRGGYYTQYPENSLSIIEYVHTAFHQSPIMIEIDLRMDKNNKIWLMHDTTLERTTDGSGSISLMSSKNIKRLRLKNQDGNLTKHKALCFETLLKYCYGKNIYLMLDIKGDFYTEVDLILKKTNMSRNCIVLTFDKKQTQNALKKLNNVIVSSLVTSLEDLHFLNDYPNQVAAHIPPDSPMHLFAEATSLKIPIVSDLRELYNGYYKPLNTETYLKFLSDYKPNIFVTDFPIEVNNITELKLQEKQLEEIHHKKFDWFISKNFDALENLLHEQVTYIHSNGWIESKNEIMNNLTSKKLAYIAVDIDAVTTKIFDNMGIVTGRGQFTVTLDDKLIVINLLYSETYLKEDNHWKLLHRHACKLP